MISPIEHDRAIARRDFDYLLSYQKNQEKRADALYRIMFDKLMALQPDRAWEDIAHEISMAMYEKFGCG